eukprot:11957648-Ditylum_brightwellii.AAC.1
MSKLLFRNKLHLNQAYDTSFARGPLKQYSGDYGLGHSTEEVLNREFDVNDMENLPAVNYWLQHSIRRAVLPHSIKVNLTLEEYKAAMKPQSKQYACHH